MKFMQPIRLYGVFEFTFHIQKYEQMNKIVFCELYRFLCVLINTGIVTQRAVNSLSICGLQLNRSYDLVLLVLFAGSLRGASLLLDDVELFCLDGLRRAVDQDLHLLQGA